MIKDKLQIYLITYNRVNKLKFTLDEILNSPISNFDITILDNASTDGTSELIETYCKKYSNIKHIRHKKNIGGNANICRAFELGATSGKEYFWVLCDDDKYDFSNWAEVENRINASDDIICVCDYVFDNSKFKTNKAYQLFQLTFVPAGIYKTELITDDVLVNMYDAILTMFQQSVVSIKCINENKKIYVLSKPIVFNGLHFEDKEDANSLSYKRGGNENWVMERRENGGWILGYSNIISLLKDKNLQKKCLEVAIPYKDIYGGWENFYKCIQNQYIVQGKINYFLEIYNVLPDKHKRYFDLSSMLVFGNLKLKIKNIFCFTFSLTNSNDRRYKVLTLLGIKIKWKRNNKRKI